MTSKETSTIPRMATIPEAAKMGVLPECALRRLLKEGRIAAVFSGNTPYINLTRLAADLNDPNSKIYQRKS